MNFYKDFCFKKELLLQSLPRKSLTKSFASIYKYKWMCLIFDELIFVDNSEFIFFSKLIKLSIENYLFNEPLFLIFFCNCIMPYNNASADGGHPGT